MPRTRFVCAELAALIIAGLASSTGAALAANEEQRHRLEEGEKVYSNAHAMLATATMASARLARDSAATGC
ncbi:MAG: hypothetical protein WB610_17455, partial [Rhodomicrobium sp.]